jgi:prevent-host-death family protein
MKAMTAGHFKDRCVAVMDQVKKSGEPVLITKKGRPVAKLVPVRRTGDDIFDRMAGKVKIIGGMRHNVVYAPGRLGVQVKGSAYDMAMLRQRQGARSARTHTYGFFFSAASTAFLN